MRGLAVLVLVLALLAPGATAFSLLGSRIDVPLPRDGDAYAYARHTDGDTKLAPGESTLTIAVEGRHQVRDRFGVLGDVTTYHEQLTQGGTVVLDDRCHMVPLGAQAVRRDVAQAPVGYTWTSDPLGPSQLTTKRVTIELTPNVTFAHRACDGFDAWAGQHYSEGSEIQLYMPTLLPGLPEDVTWADPARGRPAEFHGRSALSFIFDVTDPSHGTQGTYTVVLADGIPAIARAALDVTTTDQAGTRHVRGTAELTGYVPGPGPELPRPGLRPRAASNPQASFVTPARLGFDDVAFALPFPFADAMEAARTLPSSGIAKFLQDHPDALLQSAYYERHESTPNGATPGPQTDGTWLVILADGTARHQMSISRTVGVGPLGAPVKVATAAMTSVAVAGSAARAPKAPPASLASSTDLARLAANEGIAGPGVESLVYYVYGTDPMPWAVVYVSDMPYTYTDPGALSGRMASIGANRGEVWEVSTKERQTTTVLLGTPASIERASALAALAGPSPGLGVGAAATGILVLLVLAKFLLVPLFTRLRRDRLLDNPVRARLYERVRAEPGIHVAELIDFAGIGEGATRHHLQQLAAHRFLYALEEPGFVRYFAAGEVPPDVARKFAALRGGSMQKVFDAYVHSPEMSLREASKKLGMSAPGVHRCRRKLVEEGLLPQRR